MANLNETLNKPGQVTVDTCEIVRLDGLRINLMGQFGSLSIGEDLFSNFVRGKLVINDAQEIKSVLPISGREKLHIKYHVPGTKDFVEGWYYIYSVSESKQSARRAVVYSISFTSLELIADMQNKISRKISGKVSIAVTRLLEYDLASDKTVEIDESANEVSFIANFWKPTQCLQYIADTSLSQGDESPDYLFYETINGGFKFKSLNKLMAVGNKLVDGKLKVGYKHTFLKGDYVRTQGEKQSAAEDLAKEYGTFLEFEDRSAYDYISRINNGYYGGRVMSYDGTIRRYTHHNREREWSKDVHLNEFSPITKDAPSAKDAYLGYYIKNYGALDDAGDISPYNYDIQRRCRLARLKTSCVVGKVYGHTGYSVGDKAYLYILKNSQIENQESTPAEVLDLVLSGVYLITSIRHEINQQSMVSIIEFMKDSYIFNPDANYNSVDQEPSAK